MICQALKEGWHCLVKTDLGQSVRGTHSDPLMHPDDPDSDDPDDSEFFGRRGLHCHDNGG